MEQENFGTEQKTTTTQRTHQTTTNDNPVAAFFQSTLQISTMDEAAMKHFETIQGIFKDHPNVAFESFPFQSFEAKLVYNRTTHQGYILIYDYALATTKTSGEKINEAVRAITGRISDIDILQCIIITKYDYTCASILAQKIHGIISIQRAVMNEMTASKWAEFGSFIVTNKAPIVNEFVTNNSPNGITPRNDYGFAVYAAPNGTIWKKDGFTIDYSNLKPVAAVTGFTRMYQVSDPMAGIKILPIPTISSIISAIPSSSILGLVTPIAIDRFIGTGWGGDWITSQKNFGAKDSNMGSLITNAQTGQLGDLISNETEKMDFIRQLTYPAWMGLDIVEGIYNIPGYENFSMSTGVGGANALKRYFETFLECQINGSLVKGEFHNECGYLTAPSFLKNKAGKIIDSRYIDWMNMAVEIKDANALRILNEMSPNLSDIRQQMLTWFPDYTRLFTLKTAIFEPTVWSAIYTQFAQKLGSKIYYDLEAAPTNYQTNNYSLFGISGSQTSQFTGGFLGAGQNEQVFRGIYSFTNN